MERRLAITYMVSATTTFGVGCVAIAVAGGGLFASAAPRPAAKQVEIVDDYIVIHSSTTILASVDAADVAPDTTIPPVPMPAVALSRSPITAAAAAPITRPAAAPATSGAAAPAPVAQPPAVSEATSPPEAEPSKEASPEEPEPTAAPTTEAPDDGNETPETTAAPAARPPIPEGCKDPRFRNGTWRCDDD